MFGDRVFPIEASGYNPPEITSMTGSKHLFKARISTWKGPAENHIIDTDRKAAGPTFTSTLISYITLLS
jgi:hypothetical protein